jgi:hypothetical protein
LRELPTAILRSVLFGVQRLADALSPARHPSSIARG